MTFQEWVRKQHGPWSTESLWCEANPGVRYVPPAELVELARDFCRTLPDHAASDFYGLPCDVIAEISREAEASIRDARNAAMGRLYGPA